MKKRILALIVTMATLFSALGMTTFAAGEAVAETDYYGCNPTYSAASADGTSMTVGWRNPVAAPSKVSLYNVTAGTETEITGDCSTAADTPVLKTVEGLTAGTQYLFQVKFDFTDHASTSMFVGGTAGTFVNVNKNVNSNKATEFALGDGFTVTGGNISTAMTMTVNYDNEVSYNGKPTLHISNNASEKQDIYMQIFNSYVGTGKKFRAEISVKANQYVTRNNDMWKFQGKNITSAVSNQAVNGVPINFDWTTITTGVIDGTAAAEMVFINLPQMTAKDLWISTYSVYEVDTNGNETLKQRQDLAGKSSTSAGDVSDVQINKTEGVSTGLSYTIPASDVQSVFVYKKIGERLVQYANVSDISKLPIDALHAGSENEFVIKTLSSTLKLSDGVSVKATPVPPKEKDYYGYAPTFAPTAEADGKAQMVLSWRNPVVQPTKVTLYDITDPKNPVIKGDDFSTAANSGVRTTLSGLTKNQRYVYKVVFDFANHASTSLFIGGSATGDVGDNSAPRISGTNWQTLRKANKQYGLIENIDTTVAHSGKASFHISNNAEDYQERVLRLPFVFIGEPSVAQGTKFKCTMWVKGNQYVTRRTDGHFGAIGSVPSVQTINNQQVGGAPINFDWKEITMEATTGAGWNAGATFINCYLPSSSAKDIWIDDIRLVEVNADGTEKELDVEGFEDSVAPGNVTEASVASVGDASATISYNVPDGIETVFVYQKIDGELVQRANIAGSGSIELDALINDQENEIIIKTLSGSNNGKYAVSEGVTLTAAPEKPKYRAGEFKLYSGTEETEKPAAGAMTVKLDVENIAMGNNFTPCLIVAVYDGDRMVDCVVADKTVAEGVKATLSADITVQSGIQNCRLKAFLWKNFDTMGILRDCKEF